MVRKGYRRNYTYYHPTGLCVVCNRETGQKCEYCTKWLCQGHAKTQGLCFMRQEYEDV